MADQCPVCLKWMEGRHIVRHSYSHRKDLSTFMSAEALESMKADRSPIMWKQGAKSSDNSFATCLICGKGYCGTVKSALLDWIKSHKTSSCTSKFDEIVPLFTYTRTPRKLPALVPLKGVKRGPRVKREDDAEETEESRNNPLRDVDLPRTETNEIVYSTPPTPAQANNELQSRVNVLEQLVEDLTAKNNTLEEYLNKYCDKFGSLS